MRHLSIILLFFTTSLFAQVELENFFDQTDQFLKSYTVDGKVDYESLKNDPQTLNELVDMMTEVNLSDDLSKNQIKAFWINAYNIAVIKSVIENYPIDSPLDVNGFFDSQKHSVAGREVTLDEIEKEILLEPREFNRFIDEPLSDYEFIKDNIDLMYCDNLDVFHCLFVTSDEHDFGILVESEGYQYARYTAYLPKSKLRSE